MKKSLLIFIVLALAITLWSCEQPESPDFQLNQQFEVPLTVERSYQFLGGDDALLDTTSEDYEDLFVSDPDGPVRLVKEEEVDFGDLNDAIPEVDVAATTVNAEVGELELTNFNSGGEVGSATFKGITGFDPNNYGEGDPVPAGSTPGTVNIEFDTDYFESAVIKEDGALTVTMTNDVGFDIDQINITLNSGSNAVGSATIGDSNNNSDNFDHESTETATLDIPASTVLQDLNVDITASWESQQMQDDAGGLVVDDISGQDLVASEVTAAIESQSFNNSGTSTVDNSSFEFQNENHFVALSNGDLGIDIDNSIDIGIGGLDISFPDIRDSDGNAFELSLSDIPRDGNFSDEYDLSGYSIYAENNTVEYEISATTENTQQGSDSEPRTIEESDVMSAEVNLSNLEIDRAEGYVVPKQILLNEDQTNDFVENIDVFNDDEADVTDIDGINQISDRITNLTFENPVLSTLYETNLGVETTLYAIIAGTDGSGNTEFLTGIDDSDYQVESSEIPSQLEVDGQAPDVSQVIKFDLETASDPDPQEGESGENIFDSSNTNSSEFFSNLPSSIRFVGVAEINEKQETGTIINPVIFEPMFGVEIPFSLSADNASYKDTVDADFSELPEENEDRKLSEAAITINYTNGLPLDMSLDVVMLDANGEEVTSKSDITIESASTGENGFVSDGGAAQSEHEISFSESEMKDLHRTRSMIMDININTPNQQSVSIQESDAVSFKVKVRAGITSTIN